MPRYFFGIHDNEEFTPDSEGSEFITPKEIRDEAIAVLPAIARDELPDGDWHEFRVRVRDESHEYIFEAKLTLEAKWLK